MQVVARRWCTALFRKRPYWVRCGPALKRTFISPVRSAASNTSCEDLPLADSVTTTTTTVFHPPGFGAPVAKAEKFARLVSEALDRGETVELNPSGTAAIWHSLRALSVANFAADFQVTWLHSPLQATDTDRTGVQSRRMQLVANKGVAWEEFDYKTNGGFFVSDSATVGGLTRKIRLEFQKADRLTLHAYADGESAIRVLLEALATAPETSHDWTLRCSSGGVETARNARVVVHAQKSPTTISTFSEAKEQPHAVFRAFPPGADADSDALTRFRRSVHGRLKMGNTVRMECRGKEAVLNVMHVLSQIKLRTAPFEVNWASSADVKDPEQVVRVLLVSAAIGATWTDFNSLDIASTEKLRCSSSSSIKTLAEMLGIRAKTQGGVALHTFADDRDAVSIAVKALATVPELHMGLHISSVGSFGKTQGQDGSQIRILRFYVRPLGLRALAMPQVGTSEEE